MESLRRICLGLLYARNELPFSEGWLIFTCVCVKSPLNIIKVHKYCFLRKFLRMECRLLSQIVFKEWKSKSNLATAARACLPRRTLTGRGVACQKKVDKIKKIFVYWRFRAVICTSVFLARHTKIGDRKMHKHCLSNLIIKKGKVALSRGEICHCRRCIFLTNLMSGLVVWWHLLKIRTFFLAATSATSSRMAKDPLLLFEKEMICWLIYWQRC